MKRYIFGTAAEVHAIQFFHGKYIRACFYRTGSAHIDDTHFATLQEKIRPEVRKIFQLHCVLQGNRHAYDHAIVMRVYKVGLAGHGQVMEEKPFAHQGRIVFPEIVGVYCMNHSHMKQLHFFLHDGKQFFHVFLFAQFGT
jgi:hypothetical protein